MSQTARRGAKKKLYRGRSTKLYGGLHQPCGAESIEEIRPAELPPRPRLLKKSRYARCFGHNVHYFGGGALRAVLWDRNEHQHFWGAFRAKFSNNKPPPPLRTAALDQISSLPLLQFRGQSTCMGPRGAFPPAIRFCSFYINSGNCGLKAI